MATADHDPVTGLLAVETDHRVRILDARDLAVAGAVLIRLACSGHTLTPQVVLAAFGPPKGAPG